MINLGNAFKENMDLTGEGGKHAPRFGLREAMTLNSMAVAGETMSVGTSITNEPVSGI